MSPLAKAIPVEVGARALRARLLRRCGHREHASDGGEHPTGGVRGGGGPPERPAPAHPLHGRPVHRCPGPLRGKAFSHRSGRVNLASTASQPSGATGWSRSGGKDVLVVFDIRRYQEDVIALCETAAKQGATIVLLTDHGYRPSPASRSHVLPAHVAVPSNWDSSAGLLPDVEALVAAVTKRLWATAKPRMEAVERLRETA